MRYIDRGDSGELSNVFTASGSKVDAIDSFCHVLALVNASASSVRDKIISREPCLTLLSANISRIWLTGVYIELENLVPLASTPHNLLSRPCADDIAGLACLPF